MNTRAPISQQILVMAIAPLFLALMLVFTGFLLIENHHQSQHNQRLVSLNRNALERAAPDGALNLSEYTTIARQLLYIEPITHLSLVHAEREPDQHFGLPLVLPDRAWLNRANETGIRDGDLSLTAFPVQLPGGPAWVVLGINIAQFRMVRYESYFLFLISATSALILVTFFSWKLRRSIMRPLKKITRELKEIQNNAELQTVDTPANPLYSELVNSLNDILRTQHQNREEMQTYVEQSTLELRETLETVEIQNIELDIARKNAVQASKAKSEFLANTSHELRTPLNGILGFAGLLLKTPLTNQQRDYLGTVEQSAQGLLTVINDILDFSKLETGELTLEYKPVFIREVIEEIFQLYAPQAHEKNLRLLSHINENVQQNLLGDPLRLKQVISNLVSNAIKFSTRGNILVKVTSLGEMDQQAEIKFSVSDNGIGLSDQQQAQLFGAFSKGDNSDRQLQGGAGLGLAIAKGLISRMHGDIGVESTLQLGSTFWFTVRLGIATRHSAQGDLSNTLQEISVMVYDADEQCRTEIVHHLAAWGVNHIACSEFNQIDELLSQSPQNASIDLVLLDAYTGLNCFDKDKLLNIIHRLNAHHQLPIIILAPASIRRLLQEDIAGLNTVIVSRPIIHTKLYQTICNQLNITQPLPGSRNSTATTTAEIARTTPLKVLVVDDNPANLKLVMEFLKGLNVCSHPADDGMQALSLFESTSFDLILMDVQMPGMDGLETTRRIRALESSTRTPIVALTAHAVDEQKTRLLLAGMDDYLSKPVSEADLKMIIERWVTQVASSHEPELRAPRAVSDGFLPSPGPERELPGPSLFDWKESLQLARNNPDLATDMLTMLLESIEDTRSELIDAQAARDTGRLQEVIHKFHGGCCYCGVPALRNASREMEQTLLNDASYESNEDALQSVLREMKRLEEWAMEMDIEALFGDPASD